MALLWLVFLGLSVAGCGADPPQKKSSPPPTSVKRGLYIFRTTGGCGCHTDTKNEGPFLAGGRSIATPFGQFLSTNITPHPAAGIGKWSEADFIKAMRHGIGPDGTRYFPVFPYPAFTRITRQDLRDLWAYLKSVPPHPRKNKPHRLGFLFRWRFGVRVWKWINFSPGEFQQDKTRSAVWNRGAYLATALGHCGECHTPRNLLGALKSSWRFAGSEDGPEGELAANITPHVKTGIGSWDESDLSWFLETGVKPDGDDVQGLMSEMIENGHRYLTEADRKALWEYLKSLPPIENALVERE